MSRSALLELRGVSVTVGGVQILADVDLSVHDDEVVGVIGPNGAGKTTLFNTVTGFLRPTSGEVDWLGEPITRLPAHRIARRGLVRTFQNVGGFADLTVERNLLLATRGRDRDVLREVRDLLELEPYWNTPVGDCSLATRKLVGIAVAVVRRPRLLLLDEPLAGLDRTDRDHVVEMVRKVHAEGAAICLIEHDIARTRQLADRLVVLDTGRKVADGHPDEVLGRPELAETYLA